MSTGINVDPDTGVLTLVVAEDEAVGYEALTVTAAVRVTVHTPEKYFNGVPSYEDNIPEGTIYIYNYQGTATDIVLPSKIQGKTVTRISDGALSKSAHGTYVDLTSVIIPDSVTIIKSQAFEGANLSSIIIPDSVVSMGDKGVFQGRVFMGNTSLTSVTIPPSVTTIGESAFQSWKSLTSIDIPNSVTAIGKSAFQNTTALTSVTIGAKVTTITGTQAFGIVAKTTAFKTAYTSDGGGAGTYVYNDSDSTWTKQ
jgi:hypothetical protein